MDLIKEFFFSYIKDYTEKNMNVWEWIEEKVAVNFPVLELEDFDLIKRSIHEYNVEKQDIIVAENDGVTKERWFLQKVNSAGLSEEEKADVVWAMYEENYETDFDYLDKEKIIYDNIGNEMSVCAISVIGNIGLDKDEEIYEHGGQVINKEECAVIISHIVSGFLKKTNLFQNDELMGSIVKVVCAGVDNAYIYADMVGKKCDLTDGINEMKKNIFVAMGSIIVNTKNVSNLLKKLPVIGKPLSLICKVSNIIIPHLITDIERNEALLVSDRLKNVAVSLLNNAKKNIMNFSVNILNTIKDKVLN